MYECMIRVFPIDDFLPALSQVKPNCLRVSNSRGRSERERKRSLCCRGCVNENAIAGQTPDYLTFLHDSLARTSPHWLDDFAVNDSFMLRMP